MDNETLKALKDAGIVPVIYQGLDLGAHPDRSEMAIVVNCACGTRAAHPLLWQSGTYKVKCPNCGAIDTVSLNTEDAIID